MIEALTAGSAILNADATGTLDRLRIIAIDAQVTDVVTLSGLIITGGRASVGGGVCVAQGTVDISHCTIYDNRADAAGCPTCSYRRGGGVAVIGGTVDLSDSHLHLNVAVHGGAVYQHGGQLTITRCLMVGNRIGPDGNGNTNGWGGTLHVAGLIEASPDTVTTLRHNVFSNSWSRQYGCAIHIGKSNPPGELYNNTFDGCATRDGITSAKMISMGQSPQPFRCQLGYYMTPTPFDMTPAAFTGCRYPCPAGTYGATDNLTEQSCSGPCPPGHFCPMATVVPIPCPSGTHLEPYLEPSSSGAASLANCIPCTPGTYNPDVALSADSCATCPPGKLSESLRATECDACPPGGFCAAAGAASVRQTFEACPPGHFNPTPGASSSTSCLSCAVGKANPIRGSIDPNVCLGTLVMTRTQASTRTCTCTYTCTCACACVCCTCTCYMLYVCPCPCIRSRRPAFHPCLLQTACQALSATVLAWARANCVL